jgi:putative transposase
MVTRKITYRLYPTAKQAAALLQIKQLHQRLYNAALEQRCTAWKRQRASVSLAEQSKDLTLLRAEDEDMRRVNAQSTQVTLRRLDLAFQAFFRRVRAGETPGFPRFKSLKRFKGWGYKTPGDGWRLTAGEHMRHGHLRLSGVGKVRLRGGARTVGEPKTCEIIHTHGKWHVSIAITCPPEREMGTEVLGLDWGVETYATIAKEDGTIETVENPQFFRRSEAPLKTAYQARDRAQKFSYVWRKYNKKVARMHRKIARQRQDFQHKLSAKLVSQARVLCTEKLQVKHMTTRPQPKQDASGKAGLHKSILDGAPAAFLRMLRYKVAETGIGVYVEAPTRDMKPSQTCHACGKIEKKRLDQRWHLCQCGARCSRDANSARVLLAWGMQHFLSILLAWLWHGNNRSQELTSCHQAQNL